MVVEREKEKQSERGREELEQQYISDIKYNGQSAKPFYGKCEDLQAVKYNTFSHRRNDNNKPKPVVESEGE